MWTSVPAGLKVLALLLPRAAALSRSLSPPPLSILSLPPAPPLDNLLGATAGRAVGAAAGTPQRRDETCPVRSEGGTRRVQLVREGGGAAAGTGHAQRELNQLLEAQRPRDLRRPRGSGLPHDVGQGEP